MSDFLLQVSTPHRTTWVPEVLWRKVWEPRYPSGSGPESLRASQEAIHRPRSNLLTQAILIHLVLRCTMMKAAERSSTTPYYAFSFISLPSSESENAPRTFLRAADAKALN